MHRSSPTKVVRRTGLLLALLATSFTSAAERRAVWTHIEYGAANYGIQGKTTVNYSSEFGVKSENPQLNNLFLTAEQLAKEHPQPIVFFVNDLRPEDVQMAVEALRDHVAEKGLNIEIKALAGDFGKIPLPYTDSAHLKNPDESIVASRSLNYETRLEELKNKARVLQNMANHSRTGLKISTHFTKYDGKPLLEEFARHTGLGFQESGIGLTYVHPNGIPILAPPRAYILSPSCPALFDHID